jgi:arginine/ornithine N-succinyltransferase beta subunit
LSRIAAVGTSSEPTSIPKRSAALSQALTASFETFNGSTMKYTHWYLLSVT